MDLETVDFEGESAPNTPLPGHWGNSLPPRGAIVIPPIQILMVRMYQRETYSTCKWCTHELFSKISPTHHDGTKVLRLHNIYSIYIVISYIWYLSKFSNKRASQVGTDRPTGEKLKGSQSVEELLLDFETVRLSSQQPTISPSGLLQQDSKFHFPSTRLFNYATISGPLHTRDWEPVIITLQALSLVEKLEPVQVRFTLGGEGLEAQRNVESYMASCA